MRKGWDESLKKSDAKNYRTKQNCRLQSIGERGDTENVSVGIDVFDDVINYVENGEEEFAKVYVEENLCEWLCFSSNQCFLSSSSNIRSLTLLWRCFDDYEILTDFREGGIVATSYMSRCKTAGCRLQLQSDAAYAQPVHQQCKELQLFLSNLPLLGEVVIGGWGRGGADVQTNKPVWKRRG